jgi:uncharacterized protein YraI
MLALIPAIAVAAPAERAISPSVGAVMVDVGTYEVTASIFGGAGDGLVGEMTASGHILERNDHLVALPACTASSCPWLEPGTGPEAEWGPQESCAEEDGLCWVELTSPETGACTVAPVLDVGPLFVKDNWWAPFEFRTYTLDQGVPAVEAAAEGLDLGYGPGISDRGYDITERSSLPAIDLAAGTWKDLGLEPAQGIAPMRVRMLWQAEIMHWEACGGTAAAPTAEPTVDPLAPAAEEAALEPPTANATVNDELNLRTEPSLESEVLAVLPAGTRLTVTGAADAGFYPVTVDERTGWAFGDFLTLDASGGETVALTVDELNLRAGPSLADETIQVLPVGTEVRLTGQALNGFVEVDVAGTVGWVYSAYLDAGGGEAPGAEVATVTSELNLRLEPSVDAEIVATIPAGETIELIGEEAYGFRFVRYGQFEGWAFGGYLAIDGATTAVTTDAVQLRAGPGTDEAALAELPAGTAVKLVGEEVDGWSRVMVGETGGWIFAAYLD